MSPSHAQTDTYIGAIEIKKSGIYQQALALAAGNTMQRIYMHIQSMMVTGQ
jgi:hypothetical protein